MDDGIASWHSAGPNGFQTILVEPVFTDKFDFVRASYDSVSGPIAVRWDKTEDGFTLKVKTPVAAEIRSLPGRTEQVNAGMHEFRIGVGQSILA